MDILNAHKKEVHEGVVVEAKRKQEYRMLGSSRKPHKNSILYALNHNTGEIYPVKISTKAAINMQGSQRVTYKSRAEVNPNHDMLWALNEKNAERKFKKYKNE